MKINKLIEGREQSLTRVNEIKQELVGMENQLNDLPFYAEYIEIKSQLISLEKSLKGYDKDIFSSMIIENLNNIVGDNFIYRIKTSTKASIKITDEDKLPGEAFNKQVVSKTELDKLIHKAEAEGKTFEGAIKTFSKSLEIL